MTRGGYASSVRSALADLSDKKRCCIHAFGDGKALFDGSVSFVARAEAISSYPSKVKCANCLSAFIAGIFSLCGSVTDPTKSHHLEFSFRSPDEREALAVLLEAHGFAGKKTVRKSKYVLYWKDREVIADFLAFLGAKKELLVVLTKSDLDDFTYFYHS